MATPAERMLASKVARLSLNAKLNEKSQNRQVYNDYESGKTYIVEETVQKAFKEYLKSKQSTKALETLQLRQRRRNGNMNRTEADDP